MLCFWSALRPRGPLAARRFLSTTLSGLECVPFQVSPQAAAASFANWHAQVSPLPATLRSATPMLLPFWVFSVPSGSAPHAVYAGEHLPRPLVAAAQLTWAVEDARPFDPGMHLGPWPSASGPRPIREHFFLYEATAWALAQAALPGAHAGLLSRRLLFPVHVLQYTMLGLPLTALVHGGSGEVWGLAQAPPGARLYRLLQGLSRHGLQLDPRSLGALGSALELLSRASPQLAKVVYLTLLAALRLSLRLLIFPPLWVGAATLLAHTILSPFLAQRSYEAAFGAQRQQERAWQQGKQDVWQYREAAAHQDTGRSWRGSRHSGRSGSSSSSSSSSSHSSGSSSSSSSSSKGKAPPYVKPGDHYAILGVTRGATDQELSLAFRREVQRFHPDHAEAGGWDPALASERTRDIIEAYRTLRRERSGK